MTSNRLLFHYHEELTRLNKWPCFFPKKIFLDEMGAQEEMLLLACLGMAMRVLTDGKPIKVTFGGQSVSTGENLHEAAIKALKNVQCETDWKARAELTRIRKPVPGLRHFHCLECSREWSEKTRDHLSPSGDNCPNCSEWCRPESSEGAPLETDDNGNLK